MAYQDKTPDAFYSYHAHATILLTAITLMVSASHMEDLQDAIYGHSQLLLMKSRVYNRREGEYPTPLWYSVTAVRQGYDLYNHIHVSQFTHNATC